MRFRNFQAQIATASVIVFTENSAAEGIRFIHVNFAVAIGAMPAAALATTFASAAPPSAARFRCATTRVSQFARGGIFFAAQLIVAAFGFTFSSQFLPRRELRPYHIGKVNTPSNRNRLRGQQNCASSWKQARFRPGRKSNYKRVRRENPGMVCARAPAISGTHRIRFRRFMLDQHMREACCTRHGQIFSTRRGMRGPAIAHPAFTRFGYAERKRTRPTPELARRASRTAARRAIQIFA